MTTTVSQGDPSPTVNPMGKDSINQEFPLELVEGHWSPTIEWAQQISCLYTKRHSKEIGNLFMSQDFSSGVVSTLPCIQISSNSLLLSLKLSKYQHLTTCWCQKWMSWSPWTQHEDRLTVLIFDLQCKIGRVKYYRDLWLNFHSSCFTPKITLWDVPKKRKLFRFSCFLKPDTFLFQKLLTCVK